jgi:hypothetical protein
MTPAAVDIMITVAALFAVAAGCALLLRAFARPRLLPEEFALAAAWIFVVGSLVWLRAGLAGSTLLGFGSPWTWLAAAHFAFAGFGALTITALACRVVSGGRALKILRFLLIAHPIAYLVTAAGISGFRFCDELGAAGYGLIFVAQLGAVVLGRPDRIAKAPRVLFLVALTVPIATMVPAIAWAWAHPIFDLTGMIRYHGIVNAVGHVGLGLAAFAWGRPPAQTGLRHDDDRTP